MLLSSLTTFTLLPVTQRFFKGLLLGWFQVLPCTPNYYITQIKEGMHIRYYHKRRCPCVAYCTYCQGMHSNDGLLVLFVEDEVRLMRVLKGVDNTDNAG